MSKKDIIKKYSNREFFKNGQLYDFLSMQPKELNK